MIVIIDLLVIYYFKLLNKRSHAHTTPVKINHVNIE